MGFLHVLPEGIEGKAVSAVEVGPYDSKGIALDFNNRLGTGIKELWMTNAYLLVHSPELRGIESLLDRKPFTDPVIHRAALNSPLVNHLKINFDHVLQGMYKPGTSDAEGDTALMEALLALGAGRREGDVGFRSQQFFLEGAATPHQLVQISDELFNPELCEKITVDRLSFEKGRKIIVPVLSGKQEVTVEKYDVLGMGREEFGRLNAKLMLAATWEEWEQFVAQYKDLDFISKRRHNRLDERATDVELVTWFGLRSEHCFHKEFNARITIDDKVNDPVFRRAFEKGWLKKDSDGKYVLENGMFKTFVEEPAREICRKLGTRGKNWIASMFEDNSGVVLYDEDFAFCIKIETHNSPSNKEPVNGAKTGLDGVIRDILGTVLGTFDAIANIFLYGTGNPWYKGWLPKGVKHPHTILTKITRGVREAGNEMQIATVGGSTVTDPRYIAKCLVFCGTIGWSPVRSADGRSFLEKHPQAGDIIFVAGQPVGIDGIGGATQSSLSASAGISLGHVQADFSFIQAKMKEYLLDVARSHKLSDITDCGAMGIMSAPELARAVGGIVMDLAAHPRKYAGILPRDISRSETQDRMVLASDPSNKDYLDEKAKMHDVLVTKIGELTDSGFVHLKYGDESVGLIEMDKLFDKNPRKRMNATWAQEAGFRELCVKKARSLEESLCLVMAQPDVASKEWFFRQKDSSVKGATIQGPLIGPKQEVEADATIQKHLDTEGRDFGAIAYALGTAPKVSDLDPYHSAQKSFIDMAGKIIAAGGALPDMKNAKWDAWAVCGNFCQPNSEANTTLSRQSGEHNLASLVREGIGIREAVEATNIPVISGKDSMKCSCIYEVDESFRLEDVPLDLRRHITLAKDEKTGKRMIEIHDPDTYLASAAVKIEDYRKCVNSAFKMEGDLVYIVGTTKNQLGASQYLSAVGYDEDGAPIEGGKCPEADLYEFVNVAGAIHSAVDSEVVASCSYIHNGGLLAAVAKAAMAGDKGAEISTIGVFNTGCATDESLLYSETPGRFVVTVAPEDQERFEDIMGILPCSRIGRVAPAGKIVATRMDCRVEEISQKKVKESYQAPLSFGMQERKAA